MKQKRREQKEQDFDFKNVVRNFLFEGEFLRAEPYGNGHINDTFAAYFRKENGTVHRYILQRINHKVFASPENLMKNIAAVTRHLREKIILAGGDYTRETLNLIPTVEGGSFYKSPEGTYWRGYIFIEQAQTYEKVIDARHFYNAGRAFGNFQKMLSDFPAHTLYETIPDFHNTVKRYHDLLAAVEKDVANRARYVGEEIAFVKERKNEISLIVDLLKQRKIPLRVTHNDTKFNNIMIDDQTGEGICVIDLDTVMPGSSLYDFGDAIRFGASSALEDEKDLTKVWVRLDLFDAFTRGFLETAGDFLTPLELRYLAFSAKLMTFECGIRFLTDYLNGDTYFKIRREEHNLDRARNQFKLVKDMEEKKEAMEAIVNKYL